MILILLSAELKNNCLKGTPAINLLFIFLTRALKDCNSPQRARKGYTKTLVFKMILIQYNNIIRLRHDCDIVGCHI